MASDPSENLPKPRPGPPPEASLPEPDEYANRGPMPLLAVVALVVAMAAPLLVWWVSSGGSPTTATSYPTDSASASPRAAPGSVGQARVSVDELRRTLAELGPVAAIRLFDESVRPYRPTPSEWAFYVTVSQDQGALELARTAIGELRGMEVDRVLLAALELRQACAESRPAEAARRAQDLLSNSWSEGPEAEIAEEASLRALDLMRTTGMDLAALRLFSDAVAQRVPSLALGRAALLASRGEHDEADLVLARLENRAPGSLGDLGARLRSSLDWVRGRDADGARRWDAAWIAGKGDLDRSLLLARAALWAGDPVRSLRAYEDLLGNSAEYRPIVGIEYLLLLLEQDNLDLAASSADLLERRFPDDELLGIIALETRLLARPDPDAISAARRLSADQFPRTVALARWLGGDLLGALDAVSGSQVSESSGALVLRTALLSELGRLEEVRLLSARAREAARLPIERRWLDKAGL